MNVIMKGKAKVVSLSALAIGTLAMSNLANAADWDPAPIVTEIQKAGVLILAIGAAIMGIIALTFGFKVMKSLVKSG